MRNLHQILSLLLMTYNKYHLNCYQRKMRVVEMHIQSMHYCRVHLTLSHSLHPSANLTKFPVLHNNLDKLLFGKNFLFKNDLIPLIIS